SFLGLVCGARTSYRTHVVNSHDRYPPIPAARSLRSRRDDSATESAAYGRIEGLWRLLCFFSSRSSRRSHAGVGNVVSAIKKSFAYGQHEVTLETGELARQADGSVLVTMADTVVLVTAVARKEADPGKDFFPLTVNYVEKTYAAGRIPGGFFKREGRPSEKETLTSRLIDRPLRPLFPEGFHNEIQIVATVLSLNPDVDPDIPAMLGASAALALSGVPFNGPIGAAKVGYKDGQYILNPTNSQLKESQLDLVVAGTSEAVLMVESEAKVLP